MDTIYLDNSSTTQPTPQVILAVKRAMEACYGNPSSLHQKGLEGERILQDCREKSAAILGARKEEIFFTASGTEANNLAIVGACNARTSKEKHLICSSIEHPSILETARYLEKKGVSVTYLPVDREGFIQLEKLKRSLTNQTFLVSIMHVNNEIGTVQPVKEIGEVIKENSRALFHCDMVQSFLRLPFRLHEEGPDLISISAHKVHGPKGVGVLYKQEGIRLHPLIHGGGQEQGLRSGTENVPAIAGYSASLEEDFHSESVREKREYLANTLLGALPEARINTPQKNSAPHILSISFPGLKGEVLLHALEEEGIYVSTGSACHSRQDQVSHVLEAIGLPIEAAQSTLRISLSMQNTWEEMERAAEKIIQAVQMLWVFSGGKR